MGAQRNLRRHTWRRVVNSWLDGVGDAVDFDVSVLPDRGHLEHTVTATPNPGILSTCGYHPNTSYQYPWPHLPPVCALVCQSTWGASGSDCHSLSTYFLDAFCPLTVITSRFNSFQSQCFAVAVVSCCRTRTCPAASRGLCNPANFPLLVPLSDLGAAPLLSRLRAVGIDPIDLPQKISPPLVLIFPSIAFHGVLTPGRKQSGYEKARREDAVVVATALQGD
jgi:hypothetical protein